MNLFFKDNCPMCHNKLFQTREPEKYSHTLIYRCTNCDDYEYQEYNAGGLIYGQTVNFSIPEFFLRIHFRPDDILKSIRERQDPNEPQWYFNIHKVYNGKINLPSPILILNYPIIFDWNNLYKLSDRIKTLITFS